MESINFMPGFKLVMKFSEKFYSDIIMCKAKTGEKGYYDMAFKKDSKKNKNSNLIDSLVFSTSLVSLLFSIICLSLGNFKIFALSFCIGLIMLIYILRKIIL